MTAAAFPRFVRRSPIALVATVLLTLLVAVIEVPQVTTAIAAVPIASA